MSRIIRVVKETFRKYPMIANSTVYGTMCVGAEFSQQVLTKRILVKYYINGTVALYFIYIKHSIF